MESVSSVVKRMLHRKPFLLEAFGRGILSFGGLAAEFKPTVEKQLGKEVKESAIVMALRRYAEEVKGKGIEPRDTDTSLSCEILMKTNICDFNVKKNEAFLQRLGRLYEMVQLGKGDFLNVTIGNDEVSIAISEKYRSQTEEFLADEEIYEERSGLVSLTLLFSGDFLHTPGIVFQALRKLAWEHINVYEIVSTMTELTVVISKEDSGKGYEALGEFIERPIGW
jgi:aspartokinase